MELLELQIIVFLIPSDFSHIKIAETKIGLPKHNQNVFLLYEFNRIRRKIFAQDNSEALVDSIVVTCSLKMRRNGATYMPVLHTYAILFILINI